MLTWKRRGTTYTAGDYAIALHALGSPYVGTSTRPRQWFDAVLTYQGQVICRTRDTRTRALGDAKALAEYHNNNRGF